MVKDILLSKVEKIAQAHDLKPIFFQNDIFKKPRSEDIFNAIPKDSFAEGVLDKCLFILPCLASEKLFLHAEPVIVQKNGSNYKVYFLTPPLPEYFDIYSKHLFPDPIKIVAPINQLDDNLVSALGPDQGCLELAVYALKKLDLETGIILNGEKGHAITELKNGDKYTTEELAKLTRSEKYLAANGIYPEKLMVSNTEGKAMTLAEYRAIYQIGEYNQLLNLLSESSDRVPVQRQNSLEDLQALRDKNPNERQKANIKKISKKRKNY